MSHRPGAFLFTSNNSSTNSNCSLPSAAPGWSSEMRGASGNHSATIQSQGHPSYDCAFGSLPSYPPQPSFAGGRSSTTSLPPPCAPIQNHGATNFAPHANRTMMYPPLAGVVSPTARVNVVPHPSSLFSPSQLTTSTPQSPSPSYLASPSSTETAHLRGLSVVCTMDHMSTKLRIPSYLIQKTTALQASMKQQQLRSMTPSQSVIRDELHTGGRMERNGTPMQQGLPSDMMQSSSSSAAAVLESSNQSIARMSESNNMDVCLNGHHQNHQNHHLQGVHEQQDRDVQDKEHLLAFKSLPSEFVLLAAVAQEWREAKDIAPPPSICRLFQEQRCRQRDRCHQIHVSRVVLEEFRDMARKKGACCWNHDRVDSAEQEDPSWPWKNRLMTDVLPLFSTLVVRPKSGSGNEFDEDFHDDDHATSPKSIGRGSSTLQVPAPDIVEGNQIHSTTTDTLASEAPHDDMWEDSVCSLTDQTPPIAASSAPPPPPPLPDAGTLGDAKESSTDVFLYEAQSWSFSPSMGLRTQVLSVIEGLLQRQRLSKSSPSSSTKLVLEIPTTALCRGHLRGPCCKFGDECRYVHVCRQVHTQFLNKQRPTTTSDEEFTPTSTSPQAGPSNALLQRAEPDSSATRNGAPSIVPMTFNSVSPRPSENDPSGTSNTVYKLLPSATPPQDNVRVKTWINFPYRLSKKTESK